MNLLSFRSVFYMPILLLSFISIFVPIKDVIFIILSITWPFESPSVLIIFLFYPLTISWDLILVSQGQFTFV